jgi:hypothetical protein
VICFARSEGGSTSPEKVGDAAAADRIVSIPSRPRELIGVEIGVPKQLLADARPLHEKADVELVGHTHAAVHLHAFLHCARRGRAGARLGYGDRRGRLLEITIQKLQRLQDRGASDFDINIKLRGAVL